MNEPKSQVDPDTSTKGNEMRESIMTDIKMTPLIPKAYYVIRWEDT